jgi:hypothetical protein
MMMTTAQTTAATDTILAIDLGKYKSVACHSPAINDQSFVKFHVPGGAHEAARQAPARAQPPSELILIFLIL